MKILIRVIVFCIVLAALAACTGTSEERLPTLLVVGFGEAAQPEVALIRTALTAAEEAEGGFTFLEPSRQGLAAPAVDFAVTERNGSRSELVVLSRAESGAAYLDFFNLQGISADAPDAFAPSRPRRALSSFPGVAANFCPEAVQVSRTGRFAVVFSGTSCGDDAAVDIFDLETNRALPRITGGTFGLVTAPPYLDQQTDTLYYLQQKVNNAELIALRLADPDFAATSVATLPGLDQRGLTQIGATLLMLYPSSFVTVPLATPTENVVVDSVPDSRSFIDNLSPVETSVLILGSNRLTVHRLLDDADEQSVPIPVRSATYDPLERFVYLASEGQIVRFDLLRYSGSFSGLLRTFTLPELVQPGPITWFKGIVPMTAP